MKSLISYIFEKQNPFNVWIMCGLPGSGKSTYIKEELPKNIEIINQDSIRVELGIMKDDEHKAIVDDVVNRIGNQNLTIHIDDMEFLNYFYYNDYISY